MRAVRPASDKVPCTIARFGNLGLGVEGLGFRGLGGFRALEFRGLGFPRSSFRPRYTGQSFLNRVAGYVMA